MGEQETNSEKEKARKKEKEDEERTNPDKESISKLKETTSPSKEWLLYILNITPEKTIKFLWRKQETYWKRT